MISLARSNYIGIANESGREGDSIIDALIRAYALGGYLGVPVDEYHRTRSQNFRLGMTRISTTLVEQADYHDSRDTPDGEFPIVRQYRPAIEAFSWELPAGLVDPGEIR